MADAAGDVRDSMRGVPVKAVAVAMAKAKAKRRAEIDRMVDRV